MSPLQDGSSVPSFSLKRAGEGTFTEADLQGKTTVLVFYPFAFSPVCTDQLSLYDDLREEFASHGATLYGVSCDATWSQTAFRRSWVSRSSSSPTSSPKARSAGHSASITLGGFRSARS